MHRVTERGVGPQRGEEPPLLVRGQAHTTMVVALRNPLVRDFCCGLALERERDPEALPAVRERLHDDHAARHHVRDRRYAAERHLVAEHRAARDRASGQAERPDRVGGLVGVVGLGLLSPAHLVLDRGGGCRRAERGEARRSLRVGEWALLLQPSPPGTRRDRTPGRAGRAASSCRRRRTSLAPRERRRSHGGTPGLGAERRVPSSLHGHLAAPPIRSFWGGRPVTRRPPVSPVGTARWTGSHRVTPHGRRVLRAQPTSPKPTGVPS
jgi:hypothetical protein